MNAIKRRASVRTYTDEPVSAGDIRKILAAAMAAPSAGNQQPWEFYVVRDEEVCTALSQVSAYAKPAVAAPVTIAFCMRKKGLRFPVMAPQDLAASVENCLLEAVELGLGAVWMGIYPESERMGGVSRILSLPDDLEPFALVALGHPAGEVRARGMERFEEGRIHWC